MPKSSIKKTSTRSVRPLANKAEGYLSQIKWGESYTSLFLGAVVVVVALILVFSFIKSRNLLNNTGSSSTTSNQKTQNNRPTSYTVKENDDLWSISEKIYGSGYNWVDLAKANNLQNPNVLYVGTKLSVPNVSPKEITTKQNNVLPQNPIRTSSYTVVKGDYLWEIAVRAYGDGYKWVEIAKANNLSNPDLIYPGNVFKLPR